MVCFRIIRKRCRAFGQETRLCSQLYQFSFTSFGHKLPHILFIVDYTYSKSYPSLWRNFSNCKKLQEKTMTCFQLNAIYWNTQRALTLPSRIIARIFPSVKSYSTVIASYMAQIEHVCYFFCLLLFVCRPFALLYFF